MTLENDIFFSRTGNYAIYYEMTDFAFHDVINDRPSHTSRQWIILSVRTLLELLSQALPE